jgi:lipopolysaccharide transport system permease protein
MSMMVKLNFPRESIILATFYDLLLSLILKLIVLIPILWILGYPPGVHLLTVLPCMLGLVFMGLSIGILIAPFSMMFNDISRFISLGLPFLMYMTPVVYPLSEAGILRTVQVVNPVTPWIERARSLLGGYEFTLFTELTIWLILSFAFFILGLIALRIALPIIIERSGS